MATTPLLTQSHPIAAGQPDQEIYTTNQNWVYLTLTNESMNQVKFASNGEATSGPELPSNQPISFFCGPQTRIVAYATLGATVGVVAQVIPMDIVNLITNLVDALKLVVGGLGLFSEKNAYGSGISSIMGGARKGVK